MDEMPEFRQRARYGEGNSEHYDESPTKSRRQLEQYEDTVVSLETEIKKLRGQVSQKDKIIQNMEGMHDKYPEINIDEQINDAIEGQTVKNSAKKERQN